MALLSRDCRVAVNHACENAAFGFNTERQWCHVKKKHVFHVTLQDTRLDSCAHGDNFVWIYAFMRLFTKEFCHSFLDSWHTCHTADQNNVINVAGFEASIGKRFLTRRDCAFDKICDKAFELGACKLHIEVFRARGVCRNKRKVHFIRARR